MGRILHYTENPGVEPEVEKEKEDGKELVEEKDIKKKEPLVRVITKSDRV